MCWSSSLWTGIGVDIDIDRVIRRGVGVSRTKGLGLPGVFSIIFLNRRQLILIKLSGILHTCTQLQLATNFYTVTSILLLFNFLYSLVGSICTTKEFEAHLGVIELRFAVLRNSRGDMFPISENT